jgi:hypothetical protein
MIDSLTPVAKRSFVRMAAELDNVRNSLEIAHSRITTLEQGLEAAERRRNEEYPTSRPTAVNASGPNPFTGEFKRPVKVVFDIQLEELWHPMEVVWKAMQNDPRFQTTVVVLPPQERWLDRQRTVADRLAEAGIDFVKYPYYDIERNRPDIAFVERPYDHFRPREFHAKALHARGVRMVYLPYALELAGGDQNCDEKHNCDLQRLAWRIFVRSDRAKTAYGKYCGAGNNHVVASGHPVIESLVTFERSQANKQMAEFIGSRKAILWNPHFTERKDGKGWSTFKRWKDLLVAEAQRRKDFVLLLRPHPFLLQNLIAEGVMTAEEVDEFKRLFETSDWLYLDNTNDSRHAIVLSDAMISDISSMLLLYQTTGKPILHTFNPNGPGYNYDGDVCRSYYSADSDESVKQFIDMALRGEDPMREQRLEAHKLYIPGPHVGIGKRIADHIYESLVREY